MQQPSRRRRIVQVVPPLTGGVRDFAESLRSEWARSGVDSDLIALGRAAVAVRPLHERMALAACGAPVALLLHISPYGYDPRGLCRWVLDELDAARRKLGARLRVLALFHEIYATGSPWRSAFWLGGLQAALARRLARAADVLWTNSERHAAWLREAVDGAKPLVAMPVFSNVGEPLHLPRPSERRPAVLVFGSESTRQRALSKVARHAGALHALGITRVTEVGSGAPTVPRCGLPHAFLGRLAPPQVSRQLLLHRWGMLEYPAAQLGKSGVFAAYAAHGCVAINVSDEPGEAEELRAGQHYLVPRGPSRVSGEECGAMAHAAAEWYRGHGLARQAAMFIDMLDPPAAGSDVVVPVVRPIPAAARADVRRAS